MPKKRIDKKHRVKCSMQVLELSKAGSAMEFEIYSDNEKIGHVTIGQGTFTWRGAKRHNSVYWSWTEFAKMMEQHY